MMQKFLSIIVCFFLGIFFVISGAISKIAHFSYGNLLLLLGMLFKSLALILLIIKIIKQPKKEKL